MSFLIKFVDSMVNVGDIKDCYGCGVCATICAKQAISIELSNTGFYTPIIDDSICNNCGLCKEVCSFTYNELSSTAEVLKAYGAWSKDHNVRINCSSGGVSYELGRYLLSEGYKVCGVTYNIKTQRAEHYIANNEEELKLSRGSKYIQSYTVDGFRAINRKEKYLVTGTPCQIDSFRRYIKKFNVENNFILMDFFCHSVPSMLAWRKYLQIVEKETGPVIYASWRNKFNGWHDSWAMAIDGSKVIKEDCLDLNSSDRYKNVEGNKHQYISRLSQGDLFYKLFLGDFCSNSACQKKCKYKYDKSSADIRIGDFWGKTYQKDEYGVSAVVAYTDKGDKLLKKINCSLVEHPFAVVAEGQMVKNISRAYLSPIVYRLLKMKSSSKVVLQLVIWLESLLKLPKRIINKINRLIWEK